MNYQWKRNGSPIFAATSPSYTKSGVTVVDDNLDEYTVTVSNAVGTVTSTAAVLAVSGPVYGLSGFHAVVPTDAQDVIGVSYRVKVVANASVGIRLIFGVNRFFAPGSPVTYTQEANVYSSRLASYASGSCTTWPLLGTYLEAQSSLRIAVPDYPFYFGAAPQATGMVTGDPGGYPIQTYLIDDIPNLWKTDAINQFDADGLEAVITLERGPTTNDITRFSNCNRTLANTLYRIWRIRVEFESRGSTQFEMIVPDASGKYITPNEILNFFSEFLHGAGNFVVHYWGFSYKRESDGAWKAITTFASNARYDGSGANFGVRVVGLPGERRIEFSNIQGQTYLRRSTEFSF